MNSQPKPPRIRTSLIALSMFAAVLAPIALGTSAGASHQYDRPNPVDPNAIIPGDVAYDGWNDVWGQSL